ncbi:MAG TPA: helix-turn-helix domain-containing protein [Leadbetterella sp.]|nr:helix-turn-helix domain-containing protein [Leadbetterella sp.]
MLLQALANIILWFNNSEYVSRFPYLIFAALGLRFLWGPFLFFFVKSAIGHDTKKDILHYIPFLLVFAYLIFQTFLLSKNDLGNLVTQKETLFNKYKSFNFAIYFQNVAYILACILTVFKYQSDIQKQYSNLEKIKLNWLFNILIVLALVHFMIPIIFLYLDLQYFKNLYLIQLPVLLYISWNTKKQPDLFVEKFNFTNKKTEPQTEKIEDKKHILTTLMEKEKPYLNTDLTIKNLADLINLPAYQVSELLNKGFNKTFYDFVNYYRIEEAKSQLLNPENDYLTLDGIGNNCGFKSKSTFFAIFKKFTNKTPSEYRNSQKTD